MDSTTLSIDDFLDAAKEFVVKSNKIGDCWTLNENVSEKIKSYLKKDAFIQHVDDKIHSLLKVQYVIYYNLSYGVPAFSFNVWNSSGSLLTLEEVRKMSFIQLNEKDFYSVITQQEHPIFQRPYFIVHPCHTDSILSEFKSSSKNIIVTYLGLITPLIRLSLPMEYGL